MSSSFAVTNSGDGLVILSPSGPSPDGGGMMLYREDEFGDEPADFRRGEKAAERLGQAV
jgi:hypothetical protein